MSMNMYSDSIGIFLRDIGITQRLNINFGLSQYVQYPPHPAGAGAGAGRA